MVFSYPKIQIKPDLSRKRSWKFGKCSNPPNETCRIQKWNQKKYTRLLAKNLRNFLNSPRIEIPAGNVFNGLLWSFGVKKPKNLRNFLNSPRIEIPAGNVFNGLLWSFGVNTVKFKLRWGKSKPWKVNCASMAACGALFFGEDIPDSPNIDFQKVWDWSDIVVCRKRVH